MSLAASAKSAATPDAPAIVDERCAVTWRELDGTLNRAANALLRTDLGPDRRVGVFAGNSAETVSAYLAGFHAGVSNVPISFHLTVQETAYILQDAGIGLLFVGPETAEVGLAAARMAGISKVVGWRCREQPGLIGWQQWLDGSDGSEPPVDARPRPYLHYTSGTTGRPKGTETPPAMFPRVADIKALFEALRKDAAMLPQGPVLVSGPLYHTGPLTSIKALAAGIPLVVLDRFDSEKVLQAIQQWSVTTTMMVPTHFQRLLALPESVRKSHDVSSLRFVLHTGAACPRDVKKEMIDWLGPVLVEAYGGTESGTTNMISSVEWLERPGSVGRCVPPFEVVVIGEDGSRLGPNQVGQLYFRDPTGRGVVYHNDPEKTRSAHLEPGVFTLGEVGYVDDAGYVFITDRVSDMIVSGGVNIYPAEAEQVLAQHSQVADVAVIGVPHAEMGEAVKALIVPRNPSQPPTADELDRFCRSALAGFKCPRSYDIVPDVGRNAMGKVNKRALRKPYWPTERTIGG